MRTALLIAALLPLHAEIVDRIAVSAGNRVVTTSQIEREIRISAFLDGVQPDLSPGARRKMADRLVDQLLIRRELETSHYPTPSPTEIEPIFADFRKRQFPSEDQYQRMLAAYGITEQDVKDELLWQRSMLSFLAVRFRPAIQVTEEQIQQYFETNVAPSNPGASLDDYRAQIEEQLAAKVADREMETWLASARKRTEIIYHDEAFQ